MCERERECVCEYEREKVGDFHTVQNGDLERRAVLCKDFTVGAGNECNYSNNTLHVLNTSLQTNRTVLGK